MKLVDLDLKKYLEVLKSDAPAPGGGSVSALAGAQGVGLFIMVADLTIGKEKYVDYQEICLTARERGEELYKKLVKGVDEDTEAFNLVSAAFKMAKNTDEEKEARKKAIAEGTLVATKVPFETMSSCYEGLKIAKTMVGKSNPSAASDLGVAVLNLMAGIKGAWLNVKINLPGVKDEQKAEYYEKEGNSILKNAETMAKELYNEILNTL